MIPFWKKEPSTWIFALLLASFSTVFFTCVPLAIKSAASGKLDLVQDLLPIVGVKSLTTAVVILLLIGRSNFDPKIHSRDQIYSILSRIAVNFGWVFVLSMAIPSGTAVFLFFSYPFIALLLSWNQITRWAIFSMIVSSFGVVICVGSEFRSTGYLGVSVALATALANGSYIHFISKVPSFKMKVSAFVWTELICGLFTFSLFWSRELPSESALSGMICSGYALGLGMFLLLKSLSKLKGHESSQVILLQPLLTVIVGIMILGETISLSVFAGGSMILLGCFLRFMPRRARV